MSGTLRSAILAAADALEASREALCLLDSTSGDGDHGVTMTIGARRVRSQLEQQPTDEPEALVRAAAVGMAGAGGTIGAVYGRGLLAIAAGLRQASPAAAGLPQSSDAEMVAQLAAAVDQAVAATAGLGAKPGDKTVLDALVPMATVLAAAVRGGSALPQALIEADEAARQGADATVDLVARVGRSARFAERSRGTVDPGAASLAIIVHALVSSALDRVGGSDPGTGSQLPWAAG